MTLAEGHPSSLAKTFLKLLGHLRLPRSSPSPEVSPASWSEGPLPPPLLLFVLTPSWHVLLGGSE